jgi:hypothetical protein
MENCRFHNLKRCDGINCSRTLDISKIAVLGDHLSCDLLETTLSLSNSTTMDCGIHYCFLHTDVNTALHPVQKVQAKFTFVCQFMGLQQTMAELDS